jgi:23S rRNA (cytidine1920-2'-O)/16S rRNA (cytidine1409-2'-O)-methyltransferase
MTAAKRADLALVERGLFESRAKAREAIEAGLVRAQGALVRKPSEQIAPDATIDATPPYPWVSRGGVKLAAALDAFAVDPTGRFCLDIGASTGGFTDVLLARGAAHVCAVDVGTQQLHRKLLADPRVRSLESTDARDLTSDMVGEAPSLIVCDASFISLTKLLPAILPLAAERAFFIGLIKPQFEAGRGGTKKGIVRDPHKHAEIRAHILACIEDLGWRSLGVIDSPITGGDGNREFLIAAQRA